MNSHFKKNRKGNTGKIGVWDVKKINKKRIWNVVVEELQEIEYS